MSSTAQSQLGVSLRIHATKHSVLSDKIRRFGVFLSQIRAPSWPLDFILSPSSCDRKSAKSIILNTTFLVFNAKFLVFDTQFLVLNTKFLVFNAKFMIFSHHPAQAIGALIAPGLIIKSSAFQQEIRILQ